MAHSLLIIFTLIFLGILCEKRQVFSSAQIEGFEIFLFKIALPCYLFTAALNYDISTLLQVDYLCSYLLSFLVVSLITVAYFWRSHNSPRLCIKILASGYVNTAIYSLPIITLLLGDPKAAILSNLIQVIIIQSIFITILGFLSHHEKSVAHRLFLSLSSP